MTIKFIIAGGVATGTSFLSATLVHHPDIYLPRIQRPEPNFFHYSWKFNQGLEWYREQWFHEVGNQHAVGERSSLLLPSNVAAKRLKESIPDVRLIFCLRNPIERAWANYRFTVLEGLESLPFDEAIDCEKDRALMAEGKWAEVQPHAYLARSHYAEHLEEFIELFGRDHILLIKSEELGRNPHENLKHVCEFLGVDSSIRLPLPPNYSSPSIVDRKLQMELRNHFGDRFAEIVECIRREGDISALINSRVDSPKVELLRSNLLGGKEPMPNETRRRLQSIFANEIARIKPLVDFSIDDWQ